MPENRAARRRKEREGGGTPFYRRPEVLTGAIIAAMGVATFIIVIVLLSDGGGDNGDSVANPSTTAEPVIFEPETADDVAIDQLARRTVEALPQGMWPDLYPSFTQEYQDRCPQEEFIQAGIASAEQLGQAVETIQYVRLQDVSYLDESSVRLVIVGSVPQGEYTLEAYFQRVDGTWKIAPNPGTEGCNAFSRLSDPPTTAP